jgi:hypothetical protein
MKSRLLTSWLLASSILLTAVLAIGNPTLRTGSLFSLELVQAKAPLFASFSSQDWKALWAREIQDDKTDRITLKKYLIPQDSSCLVKSDILLEQDKIKLLHFPPIHLTGWDEDPYHSRTWQFFLHGLSPVSCLIATYEQIGNVQYLNKAYEITFSWLKTYPRYIPGSHSFAWHDHALARRVETLTYLWEVSREHHIALSPDRISTLSRAIDYQTSLMLTPDLYNEGHNHGFFQSRAAILASRILDFDPTASLWSLQASRGMEAYLNNAFTEEGIHKEHSPGYHVQLMQGSEEAAALLGSNAPFKDRIPLMHAFFRHAHNVQGDIVPVGDTQFPKNPSKSLPAFRLPSSIVWEKSGFASFRNGWLPSNKAIHLFFTNSCFSRIHKHGDNLGFHLSAYGRDWIVDPGYKDYNKDAHRRYATSAFAHNTIVVDESDMKNPKRPAGAVSTRLLQEPGKIGVLGKHHLYKGLTIQRKILYDQNRSFIIQDSVIPDFGFWKRKRTFDLLFHVMPDLKISVKQSQVIIQDPSLKQELVLQLSGPSPIRSAPIRPEIIKGQTKPYLLGWYYPNAQAKPLQTVRFRFVATELSNITTILTFKPYAQDL